MKNLLLGLFFMFVINAMGANTVIDSEISKITTFGIENGQNTVITDYSIVDYQNPPSCTVTVNYDNGCGSSGTISASAETCDAAYAAIKLILALLPDC